MNTRKRRGNPRLLESLRSFGTRGSQVQILPLRPLSSRFPPCLPHSFPHSFRAAPRPSAGAGDRWPSRAHRSVKPPSVAQAGAPVSRDGDLVLRGSGHQAAAVVASDWSQRGTRSRLCVAAKLIHHVAISLLRRQHRAFPQSNRRQHPPTSGSFHPRHPWPGPRRSRAGSSTGG